MEGFKEERRKIIPPSSSDLANSKRATRQTHINLIWEISQAFVTVVITCAVIYGELNKIDSPTIRNSFFLIIGFYFGRTNHEKSGGIGGDKAGPR